MFDFLTYPLRLLSFGSWSHPSHQVLIALIYAGVATVVVSQKVSGAKSVTAPISFWVLFACAMAANTFLKGFRLPATNETQHFMIYSTLGIISGSLLLLVCFRAATRAEN